MEFRTFLYAFMVMAYCFGSVVVSQAEETGGDNLSDLVGVEATEDDVIAFVEAAEVYFKEHSLDETITSFGSREFIEKDLYLFLFDKDAVALVHALEPSVEGRNLLSIHGAEGVPFVEEFMKVEDRGWVEYMWRHPYLGRIMKKRTYIVHLDGGYRVGAGYYLDEN